MGVRVLRDLVNMSSCSLSLSDSEDCCAWWTYVQNLTCMGDLWGMRLNMKHDSLSLSSSTSDLGLIGAGAAFFFFLFFREFFLAIEAAAAANPLYDADGVRG